MRDEDDAVLSDGHHTNDEYDDEEGVQGDNFTIINADKKMPYPHAAATTPKSTAAAAQRVLGGGERLQQRDAGNFQAHT